MKIYKYGPFHTVDQEIDIWGVPVKFGVQNGELFVWSEVNPDPFTNPKAKYKVFATGQDYGDGVHIDTLITEMGSVWHLVAI